MNKFLLKVSLFLIISVILIISLILLTNKIIDSNNYYKIDLNDKYLILGNSHPECAYNDSIIEGFCNYAVSGDSYFYNYFKTKKLLDNNNHIKSVFIEFSNTQINNKQNEKIFSDMYLSARYPDYVSFFSVEEFWLLIKNNRKIIMQAQSVALKENILFLISRNKEYFKYKQNGGFVNNNSSNIDSLLNVSKLVPFKRTRKIEISELSLQYLRKTIDYCNVKGIKVYLIRSPYHPNHELLNYEKEFLYLRKNRFRDVEFLDFVKFPLLNSQFADYGHLNFKGSFVFSTFFNKLVKNGLLLKTNKQEFINLEISNQNIKNVN